MIESIGYRMVELPLSRPFVIAGSSQTVHRGVILRVAAEGFVGWGEATPSPRVTGETLEDAMAALKKFRDSYTGRDLEDAAGFSCSAAPAAAACVNMALLDIMGQRDGKTVRDILGGTGKSMATSYTVSIDSLHNALRQAEEFASLGVRVFKVKVGESLHEDLSRVRALREAFPDIKIRLDGNEGYSPEEASRFIEGAAELDIEFIEQPIPRGMHGEMSRLVREEQIPIMADEDLQSMEDLEKILECESADMINIKLMKVGGISQGQEIARRACDGGLGIMVGCMIETRLSITAGLHLALGVDGIGYADLDGNIDIVRDPTTGGAVFRDGLLHLPEGPGLGASISMEGFV